MDQKKIREEAVKEIARLGQELEGDNPITLDDLVEIGMVEGDNDDA